MKQYNKIVEAVNRGINLALDNFNDEIPVAQSISKVTIKDDAKDRFITSEILPQIFDYIDNAQDFYKLLIEKQTIELKDLDIFNFSKQEKELLYEYLQNNNIINNDYVDLDLPSGTLWCRQNLGATEDNMMGDNYVWGDLEPKAFQSSKIKPIYLDELKDKPRIFLRKEDDAAYNINKHYRIPTINQFIELDQYTYKLNSKLFRGIYILISKTNPLHFIAFENSNKLYITSDLTKTLVYVHKVSKKIDKISIEYIKLISYGKYEFNKIVIPSWDGLTIPPIDCYIRPIYIK